MAEQSESERLRKELEALLAYGLSDEEAAVDLGGFVRTLSEPKDDNHG